MRKQRPLGSPVMTRQRTVDDIIFLGAPINLSAIARTQGISQPYVSQIINGDREATIGYYIKIAAALGITIDDLLNGIEERKQARLDQAATALESYKNRIAVEDESGIPPLPALRLPQDRRRKV